MHFLLNRIRKQTQHIFRYRFMTREVLVFPWFYNDIKKLMQQHTTKTFVKEGKKTRSHFPSTSSQTQLSHDILKCPYISESLCNHYGK